MVDTILNRYTHALRTLYIDRYRLLHKLLPTRHIRPTNNLDPNDTRISAYLSIYNDWSMLSDVLETISPFISELIIVDGSYAWQKNFLEALGDNPERSSPKLYDIIKRSGLKVKIIDGIWENEVEKRIAGYNACTYRYIMRIDADEIVKISNECLSEFFKTGGRVAEFYMPTYVTPESIIANRGVKALVKPIPTQKFLFDRKFVSAEQHLTYLWLVLGSDKLPEIPVTELQPSHYRPVAYCAHLTNWRTLENNLIRATFYILKSFKEKGAPKLGYPSPFDKQSFQEFITKITPEILKKSLEWSSFCVGGTHLSDTEVIKQASEIGELQDKIIYKNYQNFKKERKVKIDLAFEKHQIALQNTPFYLDVDNSDKISDDITLELDRRAVGCDIELIEINNDKPFRRTSLVEAHISDTIISATVPAKNSANIVRYLSITLHDTSRDSLYFRWKLCET